MFQEGSNQSFLLLIIVVAIAALAIIDVAQLTTARTHEGVRNHSVALLPNASVYERVIASTGETTNVTFQLTTRAAAEAAEVSASAAYPPSCNSIVKGFPNTSLNAASPNNFTRNWSHA